MQIIFLIKKIIILYIATTAAYTASKVAQLCKLMQWDSNETAELTLWNFLHISFLGGALEIMPDYISGHGLVCSQYKFIKAFHKLSYPQELEANSI